MTLGRQRAGTHPELALHLPCKLLLFFHDREVLYKTEHLDAVLDTRYRLGSARPLKAMNEQPL